MAVLLTWSGYALHPTIHGSTSLVRWREKQAKARPFVLSPERRKLILETIQTHSSARNWPLLAAHIRSTHLHVILEAPGDPSRALGELKAACTKALRSAELAGPEDRIWADYRNIRSLRTPEAIRAALDYLVNAQGFAAPAQLINTPSTTT